MEPDTTNERTDATASPEAESKERVLTQRELNQKRLAPLTHRGWTFILSGHWPLCNYCYLKDRCPDYVVDGTDCPFFQGIHEQRVVDIMKLPWIQPYDIDTVRRYSSIVTFIDIVKLSSPKTGIFRKTDQGLDFQPVMLRILTWENTATRLANELGLTPASRKLLGFGGRGGKALRDAGEILEYLHLERQKREQDADDNGFDEAP